MRNETLKNLIYNFDILKHTLGDNKWNWTIKKQTKQDFKINENVRYKLLP